jgi:hypothetical protein
MGIRIPRSAHRVIRGIGSILGHPKVGELIDFREPVGLLLVTEVDFLTDDKHPGLRLRGVVESAFAAEPQCPGREGG